MSTYVIRRVWSLPLARYIVVGGLNTLFGLGCYGVLLWLGLHYAIALLLATVLGVLWNFKTTGAVVFKTSDNTLIFRFVGAYAATYGVNYFGVRGLVAAGVGDFWAGAIMILPIALIGFFIQRRFVFTKSLP